MRRTVSAVLAALALLGPPCVVQAMTPEQRQGVEEMARTLQAKGPEETRDRFFGLGPEEGHGAGYALVQTGDRRAVDVGVAVLSVSDGGVTESLLSSLATALARRPEVVLPAYDKISPGLRSKLCVPLIPADDPHAAAEARAALARAERALKSVRQPALAKAKAACLTAVADYRKAMARSAARSPRAG